MWKTRRSCVKNWSVLTLISILRPFNIHLVSLCLFVLNICVTAGTCVCVCSCLRVYARATVSNLTTLFWKATFSSVLHVCLWVCALALTCAAVCLHVWCVHVRGCMYSKTCGFGLWLCLLQLQKPLTKAKYAIHVKHTHIIACCLCVCLSIFTYEKMLLKI